MKNKNKIGGNRLKVCFFLTLPVFLSATFFVFCENVWAEDKIAPGEIIINELMWMGFDGGADNEWLELFNPTEREIFLDSCMLKKKNGNSALKSGKMLEGKLLPSGYMVISYKEKDYLKFEAAIHSILGRYALSNEELQLSLECGGVVIDIAGNGGKPLTGENGEFKKSMERTRPIADGKLISSWQTCYTKVKLNVEMLDWATPGTINSQKPINDTPEKTEETKAADKCVDGIKLSEIYPNPSKGQTEFVEVYNSGEAACDLFGWRVEDLKANKAEFLKNSLIAAGDYFVLAKNIGLNSTNETVFLKNGEEVVDQVSYKNSKSNASYNFNGSMWRWSKWLTPGLSNVFNNLPQSKNKISKEVYTKVYAEFSAKTKDVDGDKVKYTWDFGDGHKSYLAQTKHKYENEGKYFGSLKISDGSEDQIYTFVIEVTDFPRRKVKIVAVNPNPLGKDTDRETITLKNESKRKINLEGWSIATGWKNLYNHPILEKIMLAPGKAVEITRKVCKFTLANKQTKIELRYPNGKVADKVKYKLEKSVEEGSVYQKIGKKWGWTKEKNQESEIKNQETKGQPSVISNQPLKMQSKEVEVGDVSNQEQRIIKRDNEISVVPKNIIELAVAKESKRIVLGVKKVREESGQYFFVANGSRQEHYAVMFLKNVNAKINSLLNYFLN